MEVSRPTIYRLALLSFLFALSVFSAQSFDFGNLDVKSAPPPALKHNR